MAPLPIPRVDDLVAAASEPGACWYVPVEMAIACAPPAFKTIVYYRYGQGHRPRADAKVFVRGKRFACVIYWPGHTDQLIPLSCYSLENGR